MKYTISVIAGIFLFSSAYSQEREKSVHLTTGAGINKVQGELGKVFKPTVAFNSGFEKRFHNNWFGQLEVNFNTLRYDQKEKDANSDYLFQKTNSSLFMIGLNGGKDFYWAPRLFSSLYVGTGYLNIGEPRVTLDEANGIVNQTVIRKAGVLARGGTRIGYETKSSFLQTLYIDASYWSSTLHSQGRRFNSISLFVGIRMKME